MSLSVLGTTSVVSTLDQQQLRVISRLSKQKTAKKPLILILPGMGEAIERFAEAAWVLNNLGYDVISFDWRGQGGSSRLTKVYSLCHVVSFKDYLTDLKTILAWLPPHRDFVILANSMGAHMALRYMQEYGIDPRLRAMVLTAPMIKIKLRPYLWLAARLSSWIIHNVGMGERFVWGSKPRDPNKCFYTPALGGDPQRYEKGCLILKANPHLSIGGPSFSWLEACFASMVQLQDKKKLAALTVPILIASAAFDHTVDNLAQREICAQLKHCQLIEYQTRHNFFNSTDNILIKFWSDFVSFLQTIPRKQ